MHVLLYEFVTGGGWLFVAPNARPHGSLLDEGLAMISAVAEDFAAINDSQVTILWDARLPLPALFEQMAACHVVLIHSTGEHDEQLAKFASISDRALLIAPEFDQYLLRSCRLALSRQARLISPGPEFIELTSDKHLTAERLRASGVAAPWGVTLEPGDSLPAEIAFPAVLKPRDGAGSLNVRVFAQRPNEIFHATAPMRLEAVVPGQAVSVAALCGPAGHVLLPPCSQKLSADGRFTYLGGETPLAPELADRALTLAKATLAALPPVVGYVGIDMVLGESDGGDTVIEVNPRLTTSYVGLRKLVRENLAAAMLQTADGTPPDLSLHVGKVEFTPDGQVTIHGHE
jgi:predicted ATP-grasp superfamily ATP-dependent carboligase